MIQILNLTETKTLSRDDQQTIEGGRHSRFTSRYGSSWGEIAASYLVAPIVGRGPIIVPGGPIPIPYPNTSK